MRHTPITRRVQAALPRSARLLSLSMLLFGLFAVLVALPTPTRAGVLADVPTSLPAPPTDVPPEPTSPPPAPTDPPQQVPGATDPPKQSNPTATPKPHRDRDKDKPTATPSPEPSATPVPPSATPVPQVEIRTRKSVSVATAQPGDTVVYTVIVDNIGAGTAYDVVLTDRVPPEVEVTNLESGKGDIVVSNGQVTAYPATLAPGESASYTITGCVRAGAGAGTVLNTALVTTSSPGDNPGNNSASASFRIAVPVAKPRPTAPRPVFVPHTADPDAQAMVWQLLPWALFGVAVIGVGGLIGWSILGVHTLSFQMGMFMTQMSATLRGGRQDATPFVTVDPLSLPELPPMAQLPRGTGASQGNGPRPLGEPFAAPLPRGPLPPPVALDRESVLRRQGGER